MIMFADPMAYADGRLKLVSQQRVERSDLENEIDTDNAQQLAKLRGEMATQTEEELRKVSSQLAVKIDSKNYVEHRS